MKILIMGATGYIGGRLTPRLADDGHEVRCLTRRPEQLAGVDWADSVEILRGDALEPESLEAPMQGVDVLYYLVHSIGTGSTFEASDRTAAQNTAAAAAAAGVGRIVYLGGLVPSGEEASPHLASRAEVGQIFLDGEVPAVVLQAGVIIGSGSASFEMLRYLTERLPVMVTPRWVTSLVQPIAVRDVLSYLVGVLDLDEATNRRFDIGGPDVLSYRDMMRRYATVAGLPRRIIIPVPVLTPWLSSHWINVVTPVPKAIAQPLVESLRNNVVAQEHDIEDLIPLELCPFDRAVHLALERIRLADVVTRWSGASWPGAPSNPMPTDPEWSGGTAYRDDRELPVDVGVSDLWWAIEGIGGDRGWYSFPLAWAVRGLLDRIVGGVGLRRGRRDPDRLALGDALDFWRVEAVERPRLLRLRAEMRLPGEAWLEFSVSDDDGTTVLHQRALFIPRGLAGHLYWRAISPFHGIVFGSMIANLAKAALTRSGPARI
ncbi:SDR family oxidoreductase [Aquihabitans daechungensis]|uniref:SDR family oxidoreductase n=1 Tax=Aquihabitans daechungensis TaxID=1052257 RepID=UPI003BA2B762